MLMRICTPTYEVCLLVVVPFLLVLSKLSVHSLQLRRIKSYLRNRMSDERLSGLALVHLHHDLDIDVDEICTIFVIKHKRRMFQGRILLRVLIQANGKRPTNYSVQPGLVGGVWWRGKLPRESKSLFGIKVWTPPPPPNKKFLDPPLHAITNHSITNLHITETRFLTRYDKDNIIGWAKRQSKTGFSATDWKSTKTLEKWSGFLDELWFQVEVNFFQSEKNQCRGQRSHKADCPNNSPGSLVCEQAHIWERTWSYMLYLVCSPWPAVSILVRRLLLFYNSVPSSKMLASVQTTTSHLSPCPSPPPPLCKTFKIAAFLRSRHQGYQSIHVIPTSISITQLVD